jgi:hypothetical protein
LIGIIKNYYRWKKSMQPGKSPLDDGMPWMTFDAINFLKNYLEKKMKVFEYGSGGSSVFFSKLVGEVISVEHDEEWLNSVKGAINNLELRNWKGILIKPEEIPRFTNSDPSNPDEYSTSDNTFKRYSFEKYVKAIDNFPDEYFHLIVIDGRSRPSCIKHSIRKLKHGGLVVVDNADRKVYQRAIKTNLSESFHDVISSWGPTSYSEEFTKTLVKRKL